MLQDPHELIRYWSLIYVLSVSSHFWPFTKANLVLENFNKNLGFGQTPPPFPPCWAECPTFSKKKFWRLPLGKIPTISIQFLALLGALHFTCKSVGYFCDSCSTGASGLLQRAWYQSKTLSIIFFRSIALILTQLPISIPFCAYPGGA